MFNSKARALTPRKVFINYSSYTFQCNLLASITTLIMFCKPCSVPSYCQRLFASYSGGNHLSTGNTRRLSFPPFISFGKVPLPSFGFLARGVYRVPPLRFPLELRHCGTFRVIEPYPHSDVGSFPAVSPAEARLP